VTETTPSSRFPLPATSPWAPSRSRSPSRSGEDRLACPCHEGYFSVRDGRVLQGPPQRPLPRVMLQRRGDALVAVGMDSHPEA